MIRYKYTNITTVQFYTMKPFIESNFKNPCTLLPFTFHQSMHIYEMHIRIPKTVVGVLLRTTKNE